MSNLETHLTDLVIANRILANEDIVDAYGHVSVRHPDKPDHFFLARSLAPEFITRDDILEFDVEGRVVNGDPRAPPLRPVIHSGSFIGANVPVWDMADKFGDTNLLVANVEQGRDLAKSLAKNNVALMRGHGFAAAARSLIEVVRMSIYLPRNARALMAAKQLGGKVTYLSQGEIDARNRGYSPYSVETWRAWEYWANKAGVGHLATKPAPEKK